MDCTLHLIDEKQYREIYVPAVAGDEAALNQLLEWASLLSAGWESRSEAYRLVKDLRGKWKAAVEAKSGIAPAPNPSGYGYGSSSAPSEPVRTIDFGKNLNYVYGILSAFRRPAFYARDFSFSTLTKCGLGDLATYVVDARVLLDQATNVPTWLPATATGGLGTGATSGLYLPKDRVVPFLKALRSNLKGFGEKIRATGHDAEEGLAWLISACVEAKEIRPECGILELQDAFSPHGGRAAFPAETARALATNTFPKAVVKEVRKAMGTLTASTDPTAEVEPAPRAAPKAAAPTSSEPAVPYSPQADYKVGQKVVHKKFGTGEVKKIVSRNKVVIGFGAEERTLAQNSAPGTPSSPSIPAAEPPAPEASAPAAPAGDAAAHGAPTPPPAPPHHPLPPTPGPRFQESSTE